MGVSVRFLQSSVSPWVTRAMNVTILLDSQEHVSPERENYTPPQPEASVLKSKPNSLSFL